MKISRLNLVSVFVLVAGISCSAKPQTDLLEGFADRLSFVGYAINDPGYHIWGTSPILGVERGFKLMTAYIPKAMFINPVSVKGRDFKFERPQVLQIEGEPRYLYLPSQCNLEGYKRTASFILKINDKDVGKKMSVKP